MLLSIHPKLPMRNKELTRQFYTGLLGFEDRGTHDYPAYLILGREQVELHFFLFPELDPSQNDGQVYIRTDDITSLYGEYLSKEVPIHPQGHLSKKPWAQTEFALLDPDNNLITFGETS